MHSVRPKNAHSPVWYGKRRRKEHVRQPRSAAAQKSFYRIRTTALKLSSLEDRFDQKLNDLEARFDQKLSSLEDKFDQKLAAAQASLKQCIEERACKTENTLLDEMDRYDRKYEQRFHRLENDLEILNSFYRISRNENQNFQILLKITDDLNRRLTIVEQQIAAA